MILDDTRAKYNITYDRSRKYGVNYCEMSFDFVRIKLVTVEQNILSRKNGVRARNNNLENNNFTLIPTGQNILKTTVL